MSARSGTKKSIPDTIEIYEVCLYTRTKNRRLIFGLRRQNMEWR